MTEISHERGVREGGASTGESAARRVESVVAAAEAAARELHAATERERVFAGVRVLL